MRNAEKSFFKRVRQHLFRERVDREIFGRIFPHLRKEKDYGYSFRTDLEMNAETDHLDILASLRHIERQIGRMPKAYGASFRHILHRDINERLQSFEAVGRRRIQPTSCDPRFVATRA